MSTEGRQGFVKFFGQGSNRSPRDRLVFDAVASSGSHRICTYPRGRRPRAVRDGDVMFMGHLVRGPNDIKVYGRAIAAVTRRGARGLRRLASNKAPVNSMLERLDLRSSEKLVEGLGIVFYVGMAVALLTALLGSPGWAFLLLVFGSFALVARTALESV